MRIVIADDEATSRIMLESMATRLGHECLVATDGSSAWELLSSREADVLLTDWMMPGVDGTELCRRVRNELGSRYVYIVLVTGLGDPGQVLEGMNAGADDYLVKPVDPFAVQTRLVAAERVTMLHRQVGEFRIQLEQANLQLLGLSLTDALTGIGNRRRMEEDLSRTHTRALRVVRPFSVAMFDIDHFKLYNDHYGHQAGDETLRTVAQCIDNEIRAGESIYRYGGEEFLLLLPDCWEGAYAAATRICSAVAELDIPHAAASPDVPPVVTLSGGVASWLPHAPTSVVEILQSADDALFAAKSAGRNQVHAAGSRSRAPRVKARTAAS